MIYRISAKKINGQRKIAATVWLAWLWVVLWMSLIFFFSAQPGKESAEFSQGISQFLINLVVRIFPGITVDWQAFHLLIRKNAHFFVYLILGIFVIRALLKTKPFCVKTILIALLICFLYAVSDEFHQLFVPGRSGQISDVVIDTFGAITGLGIYSVCFKLRQRKRSKKASYHK